MPRRLLLAAVFAVACAPELEPSAPTARVDPLDQVVSGELFEMRIPSRWVRQPTRTDRQAAVVVSAYHAPVGEPDLRVIVMRPVPFQGDASTFADTQLPALAQIGLQVMARRGGAAGEVPAHVLDAEMGSTKLRYWHVVRDGMATILQCGGRGARTWGDLGVCDRIAASFRLTGPMRAVEPEAIEGPPRDVTVGGFTVSLPAGWTSQRAPDAAETVVFMFGGPRLVGRGFPSVTLTEEPFEGDLDAYERVGDAFGREAGVSVVARGEGALLGALAREVVEDFPMSMGGHRVLEHGAPKHGWARPGGAPYAPEGWAGPC